MRNESFDECIWSYKFARGPSSTSHCGMATGGDAEVQKPAPIRISENRRFKCYIKTNKIMILGRDERREDQNPSREARGVAGTHLRIN